MPNHHPFAPFAWTTAAILGLLATSTLAQSPLGSAEGLIYGRSCAAIAYDVKSVLPSRSGEPWFSILYNPPSVNLVLEPPQLRPEGMVFHGGRLYVSGDWDETQNQVAVLSTNAWGELAFERSIREPLSTPPPTALPNNQWWGAEGLTFNTGAIGIGAGASGLVSVDNEQQGIGNTLAVVDGTTGVLASLAAMPYPEDIAYGPVSLRFYLVVRSPNEVRVFDPNLSPTGQSWTLPTRTRGICVVSQDFGRALTGDSSLTGDVLLMVAAENTALVPPAPNRLLAYRSDGSLIGREQDLTWLIGADDGGAGSPHEFHAVAVDEPSGILYIADEMARAVYSVKLKTSTTSTATGPLFGGNWIARARYVNGDLPTRDSEPWFAAISNRMSDPPSLGPEGLAYLNGELFVSGDWDETQNQVAVYSSGSDGNLNFSRSIALPISNPPPSPDAINSQFWGPEGLTFNTGAAGLGAGASALVTVEDAQYLFGGNTRALLNPVTAGLTALGTFTSSVGAVSPDDIAYGAQTARFYVLADPDVVQIWTSAAPPAYSGTQFPVAVRSKGLAVVSAAFARSLLGDNSISQECLLVAAKSSVVSATAPDNRLLVYSQSGGLLASQEIKWIRDALPGQLLQEIEAVAVDESAGVIYLGDEKGKAVFSLTRLVAPTITTQPLSRTACPGASVTFEVVATGSALTYQWRKNEAVIPGANASTVVINPVSADDAGSYDVVVTGANGQSVTSDAASLTVLMPPTVSTPPVSQSVCAGNPVTFVVAASGSNIAYQWRKNDGDIPGAIGSSLHINSVAPGDAGTYAVRVSNACSSATSSGAVLTVLSVPLITMQPSSTGICAGQMHSFCVVASGATGYQWQRNNVDIGGATGTCVSASIAGDYRCVVSNTCGSVPSAVATLTVGATRTWYQDADNDGFGNQQVTLQTCDQPPGYIATAGDCSDSAPSVHPGAAEIVCDGIDQDCVGGDDCPPPCAVNGGDDDADGVCGDVDNCPTVANPGQSDVDNDGVGDACDGCPTNGMKTAPGVCGCGSSDTDSDADGFADCIDGCPGDPSKVAPGTCGCGVSDMDSDADGTPNCQDGCPVDPRKVTPGICGCGVTDADANGNGVSDCVDPPPPVPSPPAPAPQPNPPPPPQSAGFCAPGLVPSVGFLVPGAMLLFRGRKKSLRWIGGDCRR